MDSHPSCARVEDPGRLAGVAVSGAIILGAGGWYWLDPAVALAIAVIISYQACRLAREITAAVQSSSPAGPPGASPPA